MLHSRHDIMHCTKIVVCYVCATKLTFCNNRCAWKIEPSHWRILIRMLNARLGTQFVTNSYDCFYCLLPRQRIFIILLQWLASQSLPKKKQHLTLMEGTGTLHRLENYSLEHCITVLHSHVGTTDRPGRLWNNNSTKVDRPRTITVITTVVIRTEKLVLYRNAKIFYRDLLDLSNIVSVIEKDKVQMRSSNLAQYLTLFALLVCATQAKM